MVEVYESPRLTIHGSIALLTASKPGSDIDGDSTKQGNRSMSDTTGGGCNAGCTDNGNG